MNSDILVEDKAIEVEVEIQKEQESGLTLQRKLEDKVARYFQNKEIAKERENENEIIMDEIREIHEKLGSTDIVQELPNGTYVRVSQRYSVREKLDKDALASVLNVAKDELKTPYDFTVFTSKGDLTPKMVSEHILKEPTIKVSVRRLKKKPKEKKQKQ